MPLTDPIAEGGSAYTLGLLSFNMLYFSGLDSFFFIWVDKYFVRYGNCDI
jgi:hypothetical protein